MYKLVIVDDEFIIRDGLTNGIDWATIGFEVVYTAINGKDAIHFMEQNIPDVLLTDVKMPLMDGIELLESAKKMFPNVRTVILSGYDSFEYAQKAIKLGVFGYVLKPVDENELIELFYNLRTEMESDSPALLKQNSNQDKLRSNRSELISHLVENLLNCTKFSTEKFKKKLSELGVSLNEENMGILAYECDFFESYASSEMVIELILNESRKYWERYDFYPVYIGGCFYMIYSSREAVFEKKIFTQTACFKEELEQSLFDAGIENVRISIGIGMLYHGIEELSKSLKEARSALDKKFYFGNGSITNFGDFKTQEMNLLNDIFAEFPGKLFSDLLIKNEFHLCRLQLKKMFDKIYSVLPDFESLCLKCIQQYMNVVSALESSHPSIKPTPMDVLFNTLRKCTFFHDFTRLYQNSIISLLEHDTHSKEEKEHIFITNLKQYICENYNKRTSLQDLSSVFYMNPSYMSTLFKQKTGSTIIDYLQQIRIEKAKTLLKESHYTINEIAQKTGFTDYRHFGCVFKKEMGTTPYNYRLKSLF